MRIGLYYRWAIDIDSEKEIVVMLAVPVARFLCRRKQKPKRKHRTFSLLPDNLIPYNRISIDLLMYIVHILLKKASYEKTLQEIDALSPDEACMISEKALAHQLELLEQTRIKLIIFFQQHGDRYRAPPEFSAYTIKKTYEFLANYPEPETESLHCAAYYLSEEYYNQNGSYHKNARFLFGTASQFCL